MQTYILSRPNSANELLPTLVSGIVDQYQITNQTPFVGQDLSVDQTLGLLSFTGQSGSQISSILVEGTNDSGSWGVNLYVITPIEIPYGSITPNTQYDVIIPNYQNSVTVTFTSGGTVSDLSGGYIGLIPAQTIDFVSGSSITGNIITTNYYLSNLVQSFDFVYSAVTPTFPMEVAIPITGITEADFNSIKTFQNNGGTITELPVTLGTYDSIANSGFTFTTLNDLSTIALGTTAAGNFYTPYTFFTGTTFLESGFNWYNNTVSKTITLYLKTPTLLVTDDEKLTFLTQTLVCGEPFFVDDQGTLFVPPLLPQLTPAPPTPYGLFYTFKGWFLQIEYIATNLNSTPIRACNQCQLPRQYIPVTTGTTLDGACNGPLTLVWNGGLRNPLNNALPCPYPQNYTELAINSNIFFSLENPISLAFLPATSNTTRLLANSYMKIVGPVFYPSNKTPGSYTVGKVFSTGANGAINSNPQDCPAPTPTPTTTPTYIPPTPTPTTTATYVPVTPTPTTTATYVPVTPSPTTTATDIPVTPSPTTTATDIPVTPSPTTTATYVPVTPSPTTTATYVPVTPSPTTTATDIPVTPSPTTTATYVPVTPSPTTTATYVPVTPSPTTTATYVPVTPSPTTTATYVPVTPTPTTTPTTSAGYCDGCSYYNVIITQNDIDFSPDGKVYLNYTTCDGTETQTSFSYAGTYDSIICAKNCSPVTLCWYNYDGIPGCTTPTAGSYVVSTGTSCKITQYSCPATFSYNVTQPGLVTINSPLIDLGQSYGNIDVSITATSVTKNVQVFVGSYTELYGEVFNFNSNGSQTKTVGIFRQSNYTTLDIVVYTNSDVETFTPYTLTIDATCPTEILCSSANTGNVYINACGVDPANGSGVASVTVRAMNTNTFVGDAVNVETGLTIYVEGTGADTGTHGAYFTILSGSNCGTGTITGFNNNEIIDSYNIVSVSPTSSTNQTFITGSGFRNSCWSC